MVDEGFSSQFNVLGRSLLNDVHEVTGVITMYFVCREELELVKKDSGR